MTIYMPTHSAVDVLICDTVAYYGCIYAIDTSNKALPLSCSSAWHKYQLDLEQKNKDAMKDTVTRKEILKAVDDEIESLKRSKLELSTDCSLTAHSFPHCFIRSVSR